MARPLLELLGDFATVIDGVEGNSIALAVDPREARHVLVKRIFEGHCLLDLRLDGDDQAYQSAILELVPQHGYLVLDALTPATGNASATRMPTLQVRTRLHNMELKFSSRIIQYGSQQGLPYFQAQYPVSVDFPQRRRSFRVAVPFDRGVSVRFQIGDGSSVSGELRDLSASGFCARVLAGDVNRLMATAGAAAMCEIDLPGSKTLRFMIEVRHLLPSRARSAPRVGVRFVNVDPGSERQLERCVAELDRQHLRLQ